MDKTIRHIKRYYQLYLMALPAVTYIVIFNYLPLYGIQLAFKNFDPTKGVWGSSWVGLLNFQRFFSSYQFKSVILNTIKLNFMQILFSFPVPVLLALLLNQMRMEKYKKVIQTVTYAPHFISTIVLVGMLGVLLSPATGISGQIFKMMGIEPIMFMGDPNWFRRVYIISGIWQSTGWNMIIYLAALSGIDPSIYEASYIDGAGKLRQILSIDMPSIMPTVTVMLVLTLGQIMNTSFEKVYLMQNSLNIGVSEVISTYVYKVGLINADYSYSTAVSVFNSVINLATLIISNTIARKFSDSSLI